MSPLGQWYMALGFGMLDLTQGVDGLDGGMKGLEADVGDFNLMLDLKPDKKTCTPKQIKEFIESNIANKVKQNSSMPSSTETTMSNLINN